MVMATAYHGPVYEFANNAFNDFMANKLPQAQALFSDPNQRIYFFCHLMPDGLYTRRLIVASEPGEAMVRVCIEASYQLFEGDVHYHVRRIGTIPREKASEELSALLPTAFERLMAWNSTHQSIYEDN